ncbi:MAG: L-histidine N(alpha)-methyltransferase [Frankia sp.]|nr:L-histidine N(alpha)-methyltransferase [Frankia sp.]
MTSRTPAPGAPTPSPTGPTGRPAARGGRIPTPAEVAARLRPRPAGQAGGAAGAGAASARTGDASAQTGDAGVCVERHLTGPQRSAAMAQDARRGLTASPKELAPTWFYDATGSLLFEKITELPEYYLTRTERSILERHAGDLVSELASVAQGIDTLVELGAGTSPKSRLLLGALADTGRLRRFVPFDVDADALGRAATAARAAHPGVTVHAVVGDFRQHIGLLPVPAAPAGALVAFLGGTIGNLRPAARAELLTALRSRFGPGSALLLGTDLVKDPARLLAAYDDSAGVTAAFNRNLLTVLNRELGADFDLRAFAHVAVWDEANRWVEMRLRSLRQQTVRLAGIDLTVDFAEGEELRTEISAKFDQETVDKELANTGWRLARWWTDPAGDFALSLAIPG